MPSPLISISTDFGPGNKGLGVMESVILEICPACRVLRLANDIPGFDIREGARLFEACAWLPVGCHICVVDPGVGTDRRGVMVQTKRGDHLIGPDNGVLIPATRFLGGMVKVHQIVNEKLMHHPVSPVFHGRDVFAPIAAHLASGVRIEEFGRSVPEQDLVKAPYEEAVVKHGALEAEVISINSFGNVFLNVRAEEMHKIFKVGDTLSCTFSPSEPNVTASRLPSPSFRKSWVARGERRRASREGVTPLVLKSRPARTSLLPYRRTFGEVPVGEAVILDDDFGRVEIALNQGNFTQKYSVNVGESILLRRVA